MSLLAKLLVKLSADSAEFQSNMEKASRKTSSFEKSARQSLGNVGKAAAAMGAAVTAATAVIVKQNLASIDSLAKTADKLGITTEALGGLRHAANLTGVSQEKLDMSLQRMTRRLAEAAQGSGEAVKAIDELGLNAQQLAAMAPEQAFAEIAGAMSQLENQSDKVRLAFKFFDSEGVSLVNTMNLGAEGIRAASKEAEDLGMTLSRVDAAKVEAANDAMARVNGLLSGMGQTLTVQFAPYIEAVANQLLRAAKESGGFKTQIVAALKAGITGASYLADIWRGWELIFNGLKTAFAGLSMFVLRAMEQWDRAITDTINAASDAINVLIQGINKIPGVELPTLDHAQYSQDLQQLARISEEYFEEVNAEFQRLATEPLPSDSIQEWLAEMEAAAQVAAEKVAAASSGMQQAALSAGGGGQGEDPESGARAEKLAAQLAQLEESLMLEEERLQASYERRREMVNTAREEDLISQQRQFELLEQLYLEHQAKLEAIQNRGLTEQEKFAKMSWDSKAQFVTGKMAEMTQAAANENKAMFAINKVAAIANATISTAQGAAKALEWGWPLGPIFAGLMVAAGAAQIAAIASTSFGGGGSTVAPSVAATGASDMVATTPAPGSEPSRPAGPVINLTVHGSVIGMDHDAVAREMYDAWERAANDRSGR